ncbi:MAG: type II toxin-antitoxin system RelE/ParE family toxin [Pirellulales bacterium]|nr:type II toxin-antitoxin system RelE/ParE family toxin [Pirellulales bacterium]
MMAQVILSTPADIDMQGAWSHIADNSVTAADRMIDRFMEVFRQLESFPLIGEVHPHPTKTLRLITVPPYVIVYQVAGGDVTIVRILHSAQQWEKLL